MSNTDDSPWRLSVGVNQNGRILAAAISRPDADVQAELVQAEGLTVHSLELPKHLASLDSEEAILVAIQDATVSSTGELHMRKIRYDTK